MEITDKDFELVDNYLDGTLSDEELALFRIRMHDEEFAGLLHFQQELRKELNQPFLLSSSTPMQRADSYYHEYRLNRRRSVSETLNSKWWFLVVAVMCVTAVAVSLIVTIFIR